MQRLLIFLGLVFAMGCGGGAPGRVSGVVTLGGQPLPDATVTFYPGSGDSTAASPNAPISQGTTDASGRYTLMFAASGEPGAVVGKHSVSIEVFEESPEDQADVVEEVETPNIVPARYNIDSELTFDVKSGPNTADWKLEK